MLFLGFLKNNKHKKGTEAAFNKELSGHDRSTGNSMEIFISMLKSWIDKGIKNRMNKINEWIKLMYK